MAVHPAAVESSSLNQRASLPSTKDFFHTIKSHKSMTSSLLWGFFAMSIAELNICTSRWSPDRNLLRLFVVLCPSVTMWAQFNLSTLQFDLDKCLIRTNGAMWPESCLKGISLHSWLVLSLIGSARQKKKKKRQTLKQAYMHTHTHTRLSGLETHIHTRTKCESYPADRRFMCADLSLAIKIHLIFSRTALRCRFPRRESDSPFFFFYNHFL